MVAVRMVSEGVDVPRLAVGVYATSVSTPLFFAQAVGRFVRARRRGEVASVFLPSIPLLLQHANEMEVDRDHVLGKTGDDGGLWAEEDALLAAAQAQKDTPGQDEGTFEALESQASFDRVLYDGGEFGLQAEVGSDEEADFLGLPGLLEPDQVTELLQRRQARQIAAQQRQQRRRGRREATQTEQGQPHRVPASERPVLTHQQLGELRRELHALVGSWHHRTGQPHGVIHAELRRTCGGPATAQATAAQLQQRVAKLREWAATRR
jgi:superfamily II DNA or RNA helicase